MSSFAGYPTLPSTLQTPTASQQFAPITASVGVTNTQCNTAQAAQAAVAAFSKEEARKSAEEVKSAVKGLGTDDSRLIKAICHLTNEQRVMASNEYSAMYGRSLKEDIKNDISGNYRRLLLGMCMPRIQYMASELHRAMKGAGTDDHCLIDVLSHTDTPIRVAIQQTFEMMYHKPLRNWIDGDTSFNFKKALLASLQECDPLCNPVEDAKALYHGGEERLGTSDDLFINILTHRTPKQIQAIAIEYERLRGHSLIKAIKNETSGNYQDFLIAIATPWVEYWATRLRESVKGLGTNDTKLIRCFIMNDRYTFPFLAQYYRKTFGKSMKKDVEDDTSFNYKKSLIALMEGCQCE
eukprot:TRINITY_DN20268_c0_g1_i1.p1 TRINITY_DN20268_c0_g1~~TRINITY_DN20268_c0_g1_i1.p1  ORF type:complete len:363 (+),score=62.43 TRINITY_DN20268_c0_g1_i1:34-1089(+)